MPLDDAACRPDSGVGGTEDGCEGGVQFAGGLLAGELIESMGDVGGRANTAPGGAAHDVGGEGEQR